MIIFQNPQPYYFLLGIKSVLLLFEIDFLADWHLQLLLELILEKVISKLHLFCSTHQELTIQCILLSYHKREYKH